MNHRRSWLTLAGVATAALILAACSRSDSSPSSRVQVSQPQTTTAAAAAAKSPPSATPTPKSAVATPASRQKIDSGVTRPPSSGGRTGASFLSSLAGMKRVVSSDTAGQPPSNAPAQRGAATAAPDRFRFKLSARVEASCAKPSCGDSSSSVLGDLLGEGFEMTIAGAYVAPDRLQFTCKGAFDGKKYDEEVIKIGGSTWVKDAQTGGRFVKKQPSECGQGIEPSDLVSMFAEDGMQDFKVSGRAESVNGVEATRYTYNEDLFKELAGGSDPDDSAAALGLGSFFFNVDVWVAKTDNWPVRYVIDFGMKADEGQFKMTFTWDMTDINHGAVSVTAP